MQIVNDSITIDMAELRGMNELKGIIANADLDVYIVRGDVATILEALQADGYEVLPEEVKQAVSELRSDPYYTMIAKDVERYTIRVAK